MTTRNRMDRSHSATSSTAQKVSLYLLLGVVALVGFLFFHIVQPYLVVIFVAGVLAVLFQPAHDWLTRRLQNRRRLSAAVTTLLVIILVLIPVGTTILLAGTQVMQLGQSAVAWFDREGLDEMNGEVAERLDHLGETMLGKSLLDLYAQLPEDRQAQLRDVVSRLANGATVGLYDNTRALLADTFSFIIGCSIMVFGLFYFLADAPLFIREFHRLLPLRIGEERQLSQKFQDICRGVVLGTVVAGLIQSALVGVALIALGVPQAWILIVLTMITSFVPFLGAAAIWLPVSLLLAVNGNWTSGLALTVYGTAVVTPSDNLVRAYVIGNRARLHPLVALVTVLGALQLIGLWGLFVGPMVAGFFYALLNIARERLEHSPPPSTEQQRELVVTTDAPEPLYAEMPARPR